jgi:hypothetical protein
MSLTWNGNAAQKQLEEAAWAHLVRAAQFFADKCQEAVNQPNTGQRRTRTRDTRAGKKGSGYTVYPFPAKKGEPPRKRTGFGQRNIAQERDRQHLKIKVGERQNAIYMIYLELRGWPWLRATLDAHKGTLAGIVKGGP